MDVCIYLITRFDYLFWCGARVSASLRGRVSVRLGARISVRLEARVSVRLGRGSVLG